MQQIDGGFWILFAMSIMVGVMFALAVLAGINLLIDWVNNRREKQRRRK